MDETRAPVVSGYEVLGILGQGGFGIVYRARQLAVGREVALKIDNRVLVSDRDRRRFMREVTSAGALSGHPHVADVYDAGVLPDGRPYMVLELCPGGSLADRLKRHGPLSVREVRDIGIKIADALAAAHAAGVLHRDVKPANILINSYGMVALSDFGLAAMPSQGGEVSVTREALTPAYAPPEAFDLTEPMATGDVYALAATLYALLHGRPPRFPESGVVNIPTIMALHRLPIPDIPGVPPAFTDVLRQAMAGDAAQRTQTSAELRDALAGLRPDGTPDPAAHREGPALAPPPYVPPPHLPPSAAPPRYAMTTPLPQPGPVAVTRPASPYRPTTMTTQPPAGPPPVGRSRHSLVFGAVAVTFALLLAAGLAVLLSGNGDSGSGASAAGQPSTAAPASGPGASGGALDADAAALGVAVRTTNCPATEVAGAGAVCVAKPECWAGVNSIAGDLSARPVPCTQAHYWETFAIARLPDAVTASDETTVMRDPIVRRVCAPAVLRGSRSAAAKTITGWKVQVLPPNAAAFSSGVRVYRCLGSSGERAGSAFS
jgi:serine/threonine protein kinase